MHRVSASQLIGGGALQDFLPTAIHFRQPDQRIEDIGTIPLCKLHRKITVCPNAGPPGELLSENGEMEPLNPKYQNYHRKELMSVQARQAVFGAAQTQPPAGKIPVSKRKGSRKRDIREDNRRQDRKTTGLTHRTVIHNNPDCGRSVF